MTNQPDKFPLKAGQFFTQAQGEYSDYCVYGLFKVLRDVSFDEAKVAGELFGADLESACAEAAYNAAVTLSKHGVEYFRGNAKYYNSLKLCADSGGDSRRKSLSQWDFTRMIANLIRSEAIEEIDYIELHNDDLKESFGVEPERW